MFVSVSVVQTYTSPHGQIRYWINRAPGSDTWLVFLPGMLTDHRLFGPQLVHFDSVNTLVWDGPAHGASRPYDLSAVTVLNVAEELIALLDAHSITRPVLIGQSFGGIVAQAVMQLRPELARGFVAIDSMPLKRQYWSPAMVAGLRVVGPLLHLRPWGRILDAAPKETSISEQARTLTRAMLEEYTKSEYVALADRTFKAIAGAVALGLPWEIACPTLLIAGERDRTGGVKRFNQRWSEGEGLPLVWIPDAAHNANADNPAAVNAAIDGFLDSLG